MIWYLLKSWKELLTNKKIGIITFIVVLLFFAMILPVKGKDEEVELTSDFSLGVVDNDQSMYSKLIIQYFQGTDSIDKFAKIHIGTEKEISEMFQQGDLLAYLVIPEGFANNLIQIKNIPIKVVMNTNNTTISILFQNILESYEEYISSVQVNAIAIYDLCKESGMERELLDRYNMETSIDLVATALNRELIFDKEEVVEIIHTPLHRYYIWAVLSMVILYSSLMAGAMYLKERQLGTYARLRIIGHTIRSVVGGILISNIVIWSTIVCGLLYFIASALSITFTIEAYVFIILCIVLSNVTTCFLASVCKDTKIYMIVGNIVLMLTAVVGGVAVPLTFLPEKFLKLSRLTPNYWIIKNSISYSNHRKPVEMLDMLIIVVLVCAFLFMCTCFTIQNSNTYSIGGQYEGDE